jgi:hypothetical protein
MSSCKGEAGVENSFRTRVGWKLCDVLLRLDLYGRGSLLEVIIPFLRVGGVWPVFCQLDSFDSTASTSGFWQTRKSQVVSVTVYFSDVMGCTYRPYKILVCIPFGSLGSSMSLGKASLKSTSA